MLMRILLLAMPDTADVLNYFVKLPNLGLVSLAGSLRDHDVKVVDLVLYKPGIKQVLENVLTEFRPQLVGLSAMTFQFDTLLRIARFIKKWDPSIKIIAGGYHVTLMAAELTAGNAPLPLDFLVREEGEGTFPDLVAELERNLTNLDRVAGLSYRRGESWIHIPSRPLLDLEQLPLPDREVRLANGFTLFNESIDVAETSRGCPYTCKFCSIANMYGRTFRRFPLDRIIADLKAIRDQGTQAVFFADDNITHDIDHFKAVCRAIVEHGFSDMQFGTQASAVGLANNPDLLTDMAKANFQFVFVGFESMDGNSLKEMAKPTSPSINRRAAELVRKHNMGMVAGVIFGYPQDTRESIKLNYRSLKKLKPDLIYSQYLTPYPKTVLREEMLTAGLVTNPDDFSSYDGFSCNIRTHHLDNRSLYQALKWESLKSYFDPSLHVHNYFLHRHPRRFFSAIGKAMATIFYMVLRGRQVTNQLDI